MGEPETFETALAWAAEHLGPASPLVLRNPARQRDLEARLAAGASLEDAVLGALFPVLREERLVADEFLAFFLQDLVREGSFQLGPALRRFLDSGDLVDSVAGDLWRDLDRVAWQGAAAFRGWLRQRLRWKASERARSLRPDREGPRTGDGDAAAEDRTPGPASRASDREERSLLALALLRLSESDRDLLRRSLRGESAAAIAEATGRSPAAVHKALQRARARLREQVERGR